MSRELSRVQAELVRSVQRTRDAEAAARAADEKCAASSIHEMRWMELVQARATELVQTKRRARDAEEAARALREKFDKAAAR